MRPATLVLSVGLAGVPAHANAQTERGCPPSPRTVVPITSAGALYINMRSGERTITRYAPEPDSGLGLTGRTMARAQDGEAATASLFDFWLSIDSNVCWDAPRADGFAYRLQSQNGCPPYEPIVGFDFGDLPFDTRISGLVLKTATLATEATDSNADGVPDSGIDCVAVFYDALTSQNRTSIAPPTAVVRVESIPGDDDGVPRVMQFDLIVDFGGEYFELGDSDGAGRGTLWLAGAAPGQDVSAIITVTDCSVSAPTNPSTQCTTYTTPNPSPDGLADFQYLQHYAQHGNDEKVTADSTFMPVASPDGDVTITTFTTVVTIVTSTSLGGASTTVTVNITVYNTIHTPDPLPQGQGVHEGFGIGLLQSRFGEAQYVDIDWAVGGCCFWFGGLACEGFLEQVMPEPPFNESWYSFGPYAQNAMGLLSDSSPNDPCYLIDYTSDGVLDNADIGGFIAAFVARDPTADLNGDGVLDNGDIGAFVQTFVACTG